MKTQSVLLLALLALTRPAQAQKPTEILWDTYGVPHVVNFGDTYVAITEFGMPIRARVLLSYGNASQPGSKHIGDQLPLPAQKKLRTALLTQPEVLHHLEKRDVLKQQ